MTQNTSELQEETIEDNVFTHKYEAENLSSPDLITKVNSFKINVKGKFPEDIKDELKKRFRIHWNGDEKAYTCPIKSKLSIEAFLDKKIHCSFEDIHDSFHDLSPNEQKARNLELAARIATGEAVISQLPFIQSEIKCVNEYWRSRCENWRELKFEDFKKIQKDELINLLQTENPKEYEHLQLIYEQINDFNKKHKKVIQYTEKSNELRSKDSSKEIRYGDYVVDSKGLYYYPEIKKDDQETTEQNEETKKIWISSPIWPEAHLRDKSGKNHSLLLKVFDGEKNHLLAIPKRIIAKWGDINEILLDLNQITPTYPTLQKHFLNFLMAANPEKKMRCVDKSGWHGEQYVFPDGEVLGKMQDSNESVYPLNEACPKGIEKKGSIQEWQDNVLKLCANNSRLIFSIGVSLSAPCLQLSGDEGGVFNFKGVSSIGKTRCLMVAISAFGSPEFKRSWRTTSNGLEGVCSLHNDCLLALDEFGQADAKEVGEIAYMYSQGIGKQRSSRDGLPKEPKTWRGMLFSTGEVGISDHMQDDKNKPKAGQLVRVIDIPAQVEGAFGCFEELHGFENGIDGERFADIIKEVCGEYYGTAGREFIKAMIEFGVEKSKKHLKFSRDDFAANVARKYDGQVKRVANRFGLVFASLSLGIELGIFSKYLTKEMAENAVKNCFNDWLNDRGTTGNFESHSIINQVIGLLYENSDSKFITKNDVDDKRIRTTLWGYKEGAIFYLFPKSFKESLCKGHDEENSKKLLIDSGLLIPGSGGKTSQSLHIHPHPKKTRYYVIDLSKNQDSEEDATC